MMKTYPIKVYFGILISILLSCNFDTLRLMEGRKKVWNPMLYLTVTNDYLSEAM